MGQEADSLTRIVEALERIACALELEARASVLPDVTEEKEKDKLLKRREAVELLGAVGLVPEALDKHAAAVFLGVDVDTVEQLIRTRKLEYVQYGSQRGRVISVEALRQFLRDYKQPPVNGNFGRNGK